MNKNCKMIKKKTTTNKVLTSIHHSFFFCPLGGDLTAVQPVFENLGFLMYLAAHDAQNGKNKTKPKKTHKKHFL